MKKLILTILLLLATSVSADTLQLNWLHPTEREDNTPLLPEEISGYQVVINGEVTQVVNGTLNSVIFELTDPNIYNVTVRTVDTESRISVDALPMVTYEVFVKNPKPVTGLSIQRLD